MMLPGCVPVIKYDVANYLEYLRGELSETQKEHALTVHLNEAVQPNDLKKAKYDVVVAAGGGKMIRPPVEGLDSREVVDAVQLLLNPKLAHDAGKVLVVGGGALGCETALWLAAELKKKVSIVEVLPVIMKAVVTANRGHLIHLLEKNGVELLNCTRVKKVAPGQVVVERNLSTSVPDPYNTWNPVLPENVENPLAGPIREDWQEQIIQADLVVLATGYKADTAFYEACVQSHAAGEIHCIGDAFENGQIWDAVRAGYQVGNTI
jgi:2-enoate reductase